MTSEHETLLWATNQALSCFGGAFSIADNGFIFELNFWPPAEDPAIATTTYFEALFISHQARYGDFNWEFKLTHLSDGLEEISVTLSRWLKDPFWFLDRSEEFLSQITEKPPMTNFIMESIARMGGTDKVWKLDIFSPPGQFLKPFYESSWDDFIIQTDEGFLFLHLAVSD